MKESIDKLVNSKFGKLADKYFNSVYYIITVAVLCILSHGFDIVMVCVPILFILLALSLVFCSNTFVLMPFFLMCSFSLSQNTSARSGYFTAARLGILCVFLAFAVIGLVVHLLYYKKWKLIFKKAYLTGSIVIVMCALVLGGLGAETFTPSGVALAASIGACMFFPYTLFVNCGVYEKEKTMRYFMFTMIASVMVVGCAVLQQYIIYDFDLVHPKAHLLLGYAVSTSAAAYMVIALPLTFYFVYKYKHGYLAMGLVALELLVIIFTFARSSIIVAVPGVIVVSTALCFVKKKGRLPYIIVYCVAAAVAIVAVVLLWDKVFGGIESTLEDGISASSTGRIPMWIHGFEEWQHNPVFGLGIWFLRSEGHGYWSFHCEPLTYFFCGGLVGIAALIYHRYRLARLTLSSPLNAERVFTVLAVASMLLNALLDTAMTSQAHLLYYSVMLAMINLDAKYVKAPAAQAAQPKAEADNVSPSDTTKEED